GSISVFITVQETDVHHTLQLWDDKRAITPRRCSIDISMPSGSIVLYVSSPNSEIVLLGGSAKARIDRPVQSDGQGLAAGFSFAWLLMTVNQTVTTATVLGLEQLALVAPHISFAIENAFLKSRPPVWLYAVGVLVEQRLDAGLLLLRFPLRVLL